MNAIFNNGQGKRKYMFYSTYVSGERFYSFIEFLNKPRFTSYYLDGRDERIDYKIEHKRMMKDTIEMCGAFLNLVATIHI